MRRRARRRHATGTGVNFDPCARKARDGPERSRRGVGSAKRLLPGRAGRRCGSAGTPAPAPELEPGARVDQLNPIREAQLGRSRSRCAVRTGVERIRERPYAGPGRVQRQAARCQSPQTPLRLVFECTDGVTFAVRMLSNALVLYPPGYPPNGSLILPQVPSASGVHYTSRRHRLPQQGRSRDVRDGPRALRRLCCKPRGGGVARDAAPHHNASLTEERRRACSRGSRCGARPSQRSSGGAARDAHGSRWRARCRRSAGASAAAAADRAARDLGRRCSGKSNCRKSRPASRARLQPPAVASDAPEFAAAPDGSRRFMFDCGNGVIFSVRTFPAQATVFSPQTLGAESFTLPQIEVASGARYVAGDSSFLEPRRARDVRDPRSLLRRLHVEPRRCPDGRGAPARRHVPRARQRAIVALEMSDAALELATRARPRAARSSRTASRR